LKKNGVDRILTEVLPSALEISGFDTSSFLNFLLDKEYKLNIIDELKGTMVPFDLDRRLDEIFPDKHRQKSFFCVRNDS
jgi:hypothetical protein